MTVALLLVLVAVELLLVLVAVELLLVLVAVELLLVLVAVELGLWVVIGTTCQCLATLCNPGWVTRSTFTNNLPLVVTITSHRGPSISYTSKPKYFCSIFGSKAQSA